MHTGRIAGLDGLRGIAVLSVVAYHLGWCSSGYLGVDVFFVLSGFLITGLLRREVDATGTISLRTFTQRRLLRLYPALLAACGFVLLVSLATRRAVSDTLHDIGAALTYTGNLVELHGLLDHVWTLALEEQFYLVWPLLFLVTRGSTTLRALGGGALVSALLFCDLVNDQSGALHSYVRAMGLPLGCALALLPQTQRVLRLLGPASVIGLIILMILPLDQAWTTGWPVSIAAVVAVPAVAWSATSTGLLGSPVLQWSGLRSYSLYLWHFPVISLITHHAPAAFPASATKITALVISLAAADLSYRFVEQPFMARRGPSRALASPHP